MILTGKEIQRQVELGRIEIDPFDPKRINPNSYNVRLAPELYRYRSKKLDAKKAEPLERLIFPTDGIELKPSTLYLARTTERTFTNYYAPMLEGRSSIGRLGIFVHITAGFGDVGFNGYWTLEIHCVQPVRIYPNMEVAQIFFHATVGERTFYGSSAKYNNNDGVQPSLIYREFEE